MVKRGEDFLVFDAKSGEDITRSVLTQIIFEQEGKGGQSLLPVAFLRQMIRFYGDSMQVLVPSYLEFAVDKLTSEQNRFRDHLAGNFGSPLFGTFEEQTRKNMAMFNQALAMFSPFVNNAAAQAAPSMPEPQAAPEPDPKNDIEEMKRQLLEIQRRIEGLASKEENKD